MFILRYLFQINQYLGMLENQSNLGILLVNSAPLGMFWMVFIHKFLFFTFRDFMVLSYGNVSSVYSTRTCLKKIESNSSIQAQMFLRRLSIVGKQQNNENILCHSIECKHFYFSVWKNKPFSLYFRHSQIIKNKNLTQ